MGAEGSDGLDSRGLVGDNQFLFHDPFHPLFLLVVEALPGREQLPTLLWRILHLLDAI